MPIAFRHLKSFAVVARYGGITRAAEELHVSQPALTQTIRNLENIIGTNLFDRTAKGVTLTHAGEEFLVVATRLIADIDDALEDMRGFAEIRRGRVAIASLPSLTCGLVPKVVARFQREHPNLNVIIFDGLNSSVEEMVLRGQCDFGLTCPIEKQGELLKEPVANDELELICHRDHPLARAEEVTWRMICDHKFIGLSRLSSTRAFVDRAFASVGRVVDPSYEVGQIPTVGAIVAEGLGVTVIPRLTRNMLHLPTLVFRQITGPTVGRQICLIRQPEKSLSPAAEVLWGMIRDDCRLWRDHGLDFIDRPARDDGPPLFGMS